MNFRSGGVIQQSEDNLGFVELVQSTQPDIDGPKEAHLTAAQQIALRNQPQEDKDEVLDDIIGIGVTSADADAVEKQRYEDANKKSELWRKEEQIRLEFSKLQNKSQNKTSSNSNKDENIESDDKMLASLIINPSKRRKFGKVHISQDNNDELDTDNTIIDTNNDDESNLIKRSRLSHNDDDNIEANKPSPSTTTTTSNIPLSDNLFDTYSSSDDE